MQDEPRALTQVEIDELSQLYRQVQPAFRLHVRDRRERFGWSQVRLAAELDKIGVSLDGTAITRLEKGDRNLRLDEAWALAAVLRFSLVDYLPLSFIDLRLRVEVAERQLKDNRESLEISKQDVVESEAEVRRLRAELRKLEKNEAKEGHR